MKATDHRGCANGKRPPLAGDRVVHVYDLGITGYSDVLELQRRLQATRRDPGGADALLLTEHRPVFTLGRGHPEPDLTVDAAVVRAAGIEIVPTERGGDITYHGPGQLVAYGIIDLRGWGMGVVDYLSGLEAALIGTLAEFGVHGERSPHGRGVWVGERKIASVGLNVRRGVTMHGAALNIDPEMAHFELINACGMPDVRMTSMAAELGGAVGFAAVSDAFILRFGRVFNCGTPAGAIAGLGWPPPHRWSAGRLAAPSPALPPPAAR